MRDAIAARIEARLLAAQEAGESGHLELTVILDLHRGQADPPLVSIPERC